MGTEIWIEHDDCLQQLFRGGPASIALRDFIFQTFSIIDFISPTITNINKNVHVVNVSVSTLLNPGYITSFITKIEMKNVPPELQ